MPCAAMTFKILSMRHLHLSTACPICKNARAHELNNLYCGLYKSHWHSCQHQNQLSCSCKFQRFYFFDLTSAYLSSSSLIISNATCSKTLRPCPPAPRTPTAMASVRLRRTWSQRRVQCALPTLTRGASGRSRIPSHYIPSLVPPNPRTAQVQDNGHRMPKSPILWICLHERNGIAFSHLSCWFDLSGGQLGSLKDCTPS